MQANFKTVVSGLTFVFCHLYFMAAPAHANFGASGSQSALLENRKLLEKQSAQLQLVLSKLTRAQPAGAASPHKEKAQPESLPATDISPDFFEQLKKIRNSGYSGVSQVAQSIFLDFENAKCDRLLGFDEKVQAHRNQCVASVAGTPQALAAMKDNLEKSAARLKAVSMLLEQSEDKDNPFKHSPELLKRLQTEINLLQQEKLMLNTALALQAHGSDVH